MSGIVYCLTNPAMPNYVKIGWTDSDDLDALLKQLDTTTSVPLPFECVFAIRVDDPVRTERLLHDTFADHRVHSTREFFEISSLLVIAAMQLTGGMDATPRPDVAIDRESHRVQNGARGRRDNFDFERLGLQPGTELYFLANSDDSPDVIATVAGKKRILFEGEETSLSAAASRILRDRGLSGSVSGTEYWYFDGESLASRRRRMESDG